MPEFGQRFANRQGRRVVGDCTLDKAKLLIKGNKIRNSPDAAQRKVAEVYMNALCIASDDPRLKGN